MLGRMNVLDVLFKKGLVILESNIFEARRVSDLPYGQKFV